MSAPAYNYLKYKILNLKKKKNGKQLKVERDGSGLVMRWTFHQTIQLGKSTVAAALSRFSYIYIYINGLKNLLSVSSSKFDKQTHFVVIPRRLFNYLFL